MSGSADERSNTHREVKERRIAAGDALVAVISRRFDAPVEQVWQAVTVPDRLNRFFLQLHGDLREGGDYSLDGNASGEILECSAPHLVRLSWKYSDKPADEVTLRFSPDGDGTVLTLEHASVVQSSIANEAEILGVGAGWETPLDYLEKYLRGELPDRPSWEWYEPNPEDGRLAEERGRIWAELSKSALAEKG